MIISSIFFAVVCPVHLTDFLEIIKLIKNFHTQMPPFCIKNISAMQIILHQSHSAPSKVPVNSPIVLPKYIALLYSIFQSAA